MGELKTSKGDFYSKISDLLHFARKTAVLSVNKTIVLTYFEIGKLIVKKNKMVKSERLTGSRY